MIRVIDAETREAVPARIEVSDSDGNAYVAGDSIPVTLECLLSPLPAWLAPLRTQDHIFNPYLGTKQFYLDGVGHLSLPSGSYRLRAFKGLEWRSTELSFEVDGSAITGTYGGILGEHAVTGTIEGDFVTFGFESIEAGGAVSFEGVFDGDTIEGTCVYGGAGSGTFSGSKVE